MLGAGLGIGYVTLTMPAVEAPNLFMLLRAGAIVLIASLAKFTIFLKYMTSAPASAPVWARFKASSGSVSSKPSFV